MAEFHPLVEELGLGALHRALAALPSEVAVQAAQSPAEDEMFDRFVARLNRTGGPKISPRAIAS